jgi:hypothetical protein
VIRVWERAAHIAIAAKGTKVHEGKPESSNWHLPKPDGLKALKFIINGISANPEILEEPARKQEEENNERPKEN